MREKQKCSKTNSTVFYSVYDVKVINEGNTFRMLFQALTIQTSFP